VSPRKYFVLALVVLFGTLGNVLLSRGMQSVGQISIHNLGSTFFALFNPWVALGTILLIGFLATYMAALSWADLTFVLPATAVSYVLVALLGQFFLGEHINLTRWLGIVLVTVGVGFVAGGKTHTSLRERQQIAEKRAVPGRVEPAKRAQE
jgi:uncharacterized membrane protein